MSRVVFRADASRSIGAGHAMRALALGAEFQAGGWTVGFAGSAETFATAPALDAAPIERLVLSDGAGNEAGALARQWSDGVDVLVVDHYGRGVEFERACRPWARRIVSIDDLADRRHDADVLVDGAHPEASYRQLVPEACEVLSGPQFAIVHPAFRRVRPAARARREYRAVERVLVSFGQIDALNASALALAALTAAGFRGHVDVVLGRAAPHLAKVRAAAASNVHIHVGTDDMPGLIASADFGIGAGGVTAWERCCLGLPSIVSMLAENQRQTISIIAGAGAGIDAGPVDAGTFERLSRLLKEILPEADRRTAMARAAAALVDGDGGRRVLLAAVGSVPTRTGRNARLRLASMADEGWLLALQRRPETRRFANNPSMPSPNEHRRWMETTISDPQRWLAVVEVGDERVAMLRLDCGEGADRVNIAVDPDHQRRGIGAAALELAARVRPGRAIEAEILPGNEASLALFRAAGYRQSSDRIFRREPR